MSGTKKDNIVLIGMPGAGKSTAGVILAKVLNYNFVDSDLVIQQKKKQRLRDLIAEHGIEKFKEIENEINASLNVHDSVIATGGSVIFGIEAMEHLKKIGTVVYLSLNYQNLQKRLGDLDARGVVHENGQTLLDIYNERSPLYEKYADIVIDENEHDIEQTVDLLVSAIEKQNI